MSGILLFPPRGRLATLPPHRIIAVGRNNELARDVFSRTALQACDFLGSSHSEPTREAVPYSGIQPESAPGGPRQLGPSTHTPVPKAPGASAPGADPMDEQDVVDLLCLCFSAAVTL